MAANKTIAIIDAYKMPGLTIALSLVALHHRLLLFYRGETMPQLFLTHPSPDVLEWIQCPVEASWEADIIILAVPATELEQVCIAIKEVVTGKNIIYIQTGEKNYLEKIKELLAFSFVSSSNTENIVPLIQTIIHQQNQTA